MAPRKTITSQFSVITVHDGTNGENSVRLEISNEYDMVPTNSSGKVTEATTIFAMVHLWDGATLVNCPQLTVSAINVGTGTLLPGITATLDGKGYVLTWDFTTAMTLAAKYDIGISVTYGGKTHQATMTIAASKGRPRYSLSYNFSTVPFKKDSNNALTPATRTLKVGVERYDGDDYTFVYAADAGNTLPVRWSRDGTMPDTKSSGKKWGRATTADNNAGISFSEDGHMVIASSTSVSVICIALFDTDGTPLDSETIGIVKDGTDGNSYAIILDTSNVSYAGGKLNASIICHAILDKGSGSSDLGDTGTMKYAVGSDSGGLLAMTYSSRKWNLSLTNVSYANAPSQIILKYIVANVEVASIVVPVAVKGDQGIQGKLGRMYYYWGVWANNGTEVTITDNQTPMFKYGNNYWMWIGDNGTWTLSDMGTPKTSNKNFEKVLSDFKFILTEAIFTSFAKFGSFVISGDWMISTNGTIQGVAYNNGATYNGAASYTYFDPSNPKGGNGFVPNLAIDGLTGKVYMQQAFVKGEVHATSGEFKGSIVIGSGTKTVNITGDGIEVEMGSQGFKLTNNSFQRKVGNSYVDFYAGRYVRYINFTSSSQKTLEATDDYVIVNGSYNKTLLMPTGVSNGKQITIKSVGGEVYIKPGTGQQLRRSDSAESQIHMASGWNRAELVYYGGSWYYNEMGIG